MNAVDRYDALALDVIRREGWIETHRLGRLILGDAAKWADLPLLESARKAAHRHLVDMRKRGLVRYRQKPGGWFPTALGDAALAPLSDPDHPSGASPEGNDRGAGAASTVDAHAAPAGGPSTNQAEPAPGGASQ